MITIVTHNGKFHADDVFAVATLQLMLGEQEVKIIRTRDEQEIEKGDYVVDVGGVYEPARKRFDHHQPEGAGKRENGIPYASFGLVWKEYGEEIVGNAEAAVRVEEEIVQPIDAKDNGVDISQALFESTREFTVNGIINLFRPTIKEDIKDLDSRFVRAVLWAQTILEREIEWVRDYLEAERIVKERYHASENKQLIVFEEGESFGREVTVGVLLQYPAPLFAVLYRRDAGRWQVVAVNKHRGTYELRRPLPKAWHGLRDAELQDVTGVADAVMCHRSGFMCIAESQEGALMLAKKALELDNV